MGNYKGIEIPDELVGVIDHMKSLDQDREQISILSQQWDLLTVLGQMTGSGTDMSKTREGFKTLTAKLLSALGTETLQKTVQSLTGKAQVTVDIVIRNLFERTADIGFLATDDDIREFIRIMKNPEADSLMTAEKFMQLKNRFAEYVSKYSVYENIILMDTEGQVLCQLNEDNKIKNADMNVIKAALETPKEYVETFSKTELCPGKDKALLYSFRVRESNDPKSQSIGVLCLVFRFENELEGVFKNLLTDEDWTVLTLLDDKGCVIASSDPVQVPVNSMQALAIDQKFKITKFAGRMYLSKTCSTKGYQGFKGLGWYGHAMIPLQQAFIQSKNEKETKIDPNVLHSVMDEPKLFSEQVRAIPHDAESIQHELDRAVWNGNLSSQVKTDTGVASSNKVLLWEISTTGNKTKNVFEQSINDLHQTIVTSIMTDMRFVSFLAIDIMDRNLYERANDCRWWSLTTSFKQILSKQEKTAEDIEEMQKVLAYINGLYTVYTNIFIFDNQGKVIAVSNPSESNLVGKVLNDDFTKSVLNLKSSQKYRVSSFQETELYNNRHTYIYGAPITDDVNKRTVGGIGIVFDGEPQFRQILEDSLPKDKSGASVAGCFNAFVDRNGTVISTTSKELKVGSKLEVPEGFLSVGNGTSHAAIIQWAGQYYTVGACCSKGYREYKGQNDDYKNDIIALTFMSLGKAKGENLTEKLPKNFALKHPIRLPGVEYVDIATFHIGSLWIGIPTEFVQAAIIAHRITPMPATNKSVKGVIMFGEKPIYLVEGHNSIGTTKLSNSLQDPQVVVVKTQTGPVGIVVDKLGEIPAVRKDQISASDLFNNDSVNYVQGVVRLESESDDCPMLVVVEPTEFVKCLIGDAMNSELVKKMKELQGSDFAEGNLPKAS